MPGNKLLCAWEASIATGQLPIEINMAALILGTQPETDAVPESEAESGMDAEPETAPPPGIGQPSTDAGETNEATSPPPTDAADPTSTAPAPKCS